MPKLSSFCVVVAAPLLAVLAPVAIAQNTSSAEVAIEGILPPGWSIVERKVGEIPWGHHWCDDYKGVTGTKLVIRGTLPSKSRFLRRDNQWQDAIVGTEALDVWIMPGEYHESRSDSLCSDRPIQPTRVIELPEVRIYARPDTNANAQEKHAFDDNLATAYAVQSPESPWNDPGRLSWRSWNGDIHAAVAGSKR